MGSEMSGGVRNVVVDGCTFTDCATMVMIKSLRGRGGVIEDITYRNCDYVNNKDYVYFEWFVSPITLNMCYFDNIYDDKMPINEGTPSIRNITMENITITDNNKSTRRVSGKMGEFYRWGVYARGLPENPMSGIVFDNVQVNGRYGFFGRYIEGLEIKNGTTVTNDLGETLDLANVEIIEAQFSGQNP